MKGKRFVLRKIRNGRVKVGGLWYRPDEIHQKYDGRCDGMVYLFGRYEYHEGQLGSHILAMWGTEKAARHEDETHPYGPELMEDGSIPWYFWHEEGSEE
jgi:hypothetical protein